MEDDADYGPFRQEAERIFGRAVPPDAEPVRPGAGKHVLLGAIASVVIVATAVYLSGGPAGGDVMFYGAFFAGPEFWICGVPLLLIQVAVLARAIYVRSLKWTLVASGALAFAGLFVWAVPELARG